MIIVDLLFYLILLLLTLVLMLIVMPWQIQVAARVEYGNGFLLLRVYWPLLKLDAQLSLLLSFSERSEEPEGNIVIRFLGGENPYCLYQKELDPDALLTKWFGQKDESKDANLNRETFVNFLELLKSQRQEIANALELVVTELDLYLILETIVGANSPHRTALLEPIADIASHQGERLEIIIIPNYVEPGIAAEITLDSRFVIAMVLVNGLLFWRRPQWQQFLEEVKELNAVNQPATSLDNEFS